MIKFFKEWVLSIYWLPNIVRCLWRDSRGRFFIFRDEPDEFLRFLLYILRDLEDDPLLDFRQQVLAEIEARRRLKAMKDALTHLGY